jgi:hypothetical protein
MFASCNILSNSRIISKNIANCNSKGRATTKTQQMQGTPATLGKASAAEILAPASNQQRLCTDNSWKPATSKDSSRKNKEQQETASPPATARASVREVVPTTAEKITPTADIPSNSKEIISQQNRQQQRERQHLLGCLQQQGCLQKQISLTTEVFCQ